MLVEFKVNIKLKLALFWTTLMFLYIYADWFDLMTPGAMESTMKLETPIGPTTPTILIFFSILLVIPTLMICLSIILKPKLNKWLNIVVGIIYAILSLTIIVSEIGDEWRTFFVIYNLVEILILSIIVWNAWNWPKIENEKSR